MTTSDLHHTPTHRVAYLYLRQIVSYFLSTGGYLPLCEKPLDTYNWRPTDIESVEELDLEVDVILGEEAPDYVHFLDQIADGGDDTDNE